MQDYGLIVVPVDLEKNTQKLVDFAVNMAGKMQCEIAFFHCVESVKSIAMGEMAITHSSYDEFDSAHKKKAEEVLEQIMKQAAEKCKKYRSKVVIGDPVDEILDYVDHEKANMIIIGTHGRRGLQKILLGSVANQVLKRARCPVLVMNPYR